jgi:heterodisulfide reductase subunit B
MTSYDYFPGCSLKGTGKPYEESLLAVCDALGVTMDELEDWNCCGATAYMSVDKLRATWWHPATLVGWYSTRLLFASRRTR